MGQEHLCVFLAARRARGDLMVLLAGCGITLSCIPRGLYLPWRMWIRTHDKVLSNAQLTGRTRR